MALAHPLSAATHVHVSPCRRVRLPCCSGGCSPPTFSQVDASGYVDKKEFAKAIRSMGFDAARADLDELFDEMDGDRSGKLEFQELNKACVTQARRTTASQPPPHTARALQQQQLAFFVKSSRGEEGVGDLRSLLAVSLDPALAFSRRCGVYWREAPRVWDDHLSI